MLQDYIGELPEDFFVNMGRWLQELHIAPPSLAQCILPGSDSRVQSVLASKLAAKRPESDAGAKDWRDVHRKFVRGAGQ
eukprot:8658708-Karenia_brevis.AAC.1